MFKNGLHEIITFLILIYFKVNSFFFKKEIYVFDIDNTLADTWISFHVYNDDSQHLERLSTLAIFINMYKLINQLTVKPNITIIFLSARNIKDYMVTYNWLKSNNLDVNINNLYIVPNAKSKLLFLNHLTNKHKVVTYLDDLSYNHENGNVKFYDDVIQEISKLPLKYLDYSAVLKINS